MRGIEVLVYGLDHPEGVAWDPEAGCLWAGGEAGQVYRVELEERAYREAARAPGFVLGLAVDGRGRLVLCCQEVGVHGWDGRGFTPLATDLAFANYPAFAPDGTLYVSDSGRWRDDDGRIVRIDAGGGVETLCRERPCFTNGLAVSPDGRWLWLVESYEPRLSRYDLQTGACETVLRLDGTVPDGVALTDAGGLLITCYRPDRIYHLDADGALEIVADDPQGTILGAPTNVCFAGAELDLVVAANLGRWHLTLLDLGLRGAPLHRPKRWALDAA
jgi:gluconolactonase